MAARTGLFVAPLPGSTPAGTSPTDGRLVLGALFGTVGGCLTGGAFTASSSAMQVSIAAAVWRIPDPTNTAGVYLSPADADVFTFSAGPASGSRIDVLYVRQNNYEAGDANSRLVYGVAAGTASSTPTAPAVPAGALKIGQLTVPTGVTNAAACTLVPSYPVATGAGPAMSAMAYATSAQNFTSSANTALLTQNVVSNPSSLMGPTGTDWSKWTLPYVGRYRLTTLMTLNTTINAGTYFGLDAVVGGSSIGSVGNRVEQDQNNAFTLSVPFYNDTVNRSLVPSFYHQQGSTIASMNGGAWTVNDPKALRVLLEYLG